MDEATGQEAPRHARRKRVLMRGVICDLPATHHFDCTILDITDEGARIRLPVRCELPPVFYLINIPARLAYEGLGVWRKDDKAGVRFARTIALTDKIDPAHAVLCRLWLQAATG